MKAGVSTASLFMRKNNEDALPLLESLGKIFAKFFKINQNLLCLPPIYGAKPRLSVAYFAV